MPPVPVVFILGSGHCGSTLLDLLLDGHSQLAGVGEMERARAESVCTCGKSALECPVWRGAFGVPPWPRFEVYRPKLAFLLDRGPFLSGSGRKSVDERRLREATIRAMRVVLARQGKRIVVDSSAQTDRADFLMRSPDIRPFFIFLVRDGRGVTWSYVRKYKKLFPFIFMWATMNLKIEWFLRRARKRGLVLFLRYEDLVRDPARELARVCAMLGVPFEARMLDFRAGEHHQIEGNRTRFSKEPLRLDEAWRRDMPLSLRALFTILFGWLNAYYRLTRRQD